MAPGRRVVRGPARRGAGLDPACPGDDRHRRGAPGRRWRPTTSGRWAVAPARTPVPDSTGALWRDADTAFRIGRAVHGALAAIDLSTGTDDAGRPPPEVARARATAHGVGATRRCIVAMVARTGRPDGARARRTALARALRGRARGRRRARGLCGPRRRGRRRAGGGRLQDRPHRCGDAVDPAAALYRPQVASYALALEEATGRPVHRCVLVFVGDGDPVEVVLEGANWTRRPRHDQAPRAPHRHASLTFEALTGVRRGARPESEPVRSGDSRPGEVDVVAARPFDELEPGFPTSRAGAGELGRL